MARYTPSSRLAGRAPDRSRCDTDFYHGLLGEEIATLAARIDAATYELLVLIRKFDEQEGWSSGFLSCAHWLTWRVGLAVLSNSEGTREPDSPE